MRTPIAFLLLLAGTVSAQFGDPTKASRFSDAASIETAITPTSAKPGQVVTVKLTISPKFGWHTYATTPSLPNQTSKTTIGFDEKSDLIIVRPPVDPSGAKLKPDGTEEYYEEPVTFEFKAVVSPKATAGQKSIGFGGSTITVCAESCLNARSEDIPALKLDVLPGPAVAVSPEYQAAVDKALGVGPAPTPTPPKTVEEKPHSGLIRKNSKSIETYTTDLATIGASLVKAEGVTGTAVGSGLAGLLAAAVFWGFISLVTPCVFPMIPITVSLFLKQSHQSTAGAMKYALVYCLTIVLVLGLAAVFLLGTFQELSTSPGMNIFLGLLLIFFALSLFGMYDIQLPGFLLRATEKRRAAGGLIGTMFGAVAFSIVSFTCVAPFLGGFAGLAATGNYSKIELVVAGLTFAAAFASPFFVLAMFPSLLKKLPKSGGWLDTVKAVMGFLELAAAFKFFRMAEIRLPPVEYFSFDLVLASWVAISAACGLYLLGVFRLPHDDEKPTLGVVRVCFAMFFLSFSAYLMPGLFKSAEGKSQRPNGLAYSWVEAFLLPEPTEDMPWSFDLQATLAEARKEKKLVFVDFTGVNCTNCRFNESSVFTLPAVREAMAKYKLVQLYTDDMPLEAYVAAPSAGSRKAEAVANGTFQKDCFGTLQLPLYVILEPAAEGKVRVVGIYREGKINDRDAFLKFLTR